MKKVQSLFSKIKAAIKPPTRHQYAQPTHTRSILGWIARGVMCFELGGWNEDAAAFKEFCFDVFDTDKVEQAFAVQYEINTHRTAEEFFADAQVFLKLAGVALAYQKKKHGEDTWDLFMEQIKAMKARERERKKMNGCDMVEETENVLDRIRCDDEGVVESVIGAARRLWQTYQISEQMRAWRRA